MTPAEQKLQKFIYGDINQWEPGQMVGFTKSNLTIMLDEFASEQNEKLKTAFEELLVEVLNISISKSIIFPSELKNVKNEWLTKAGLK